jgi:hypothetical protein
MIDERPPERCCTHPRTSAPKQEWAYAGVGLRGSGPTREWAYAGVGLSGSATIDMHPSEHVASAAGSIGAQALPCMCACARVCIVLCWQMRVRVRLLGRACTPQSCTVLLRISRAFRQRRVQRAELVEIPLLTEASRCIASAGSTQRCRTAEGESRARVCAWAHACVRDWVCASARVRAQACPPVRTPMGAYERSCMPVCALVCRAGAHRLSSSVYHSR